jgi:uncharacterized lipoprotein YajG
MRTAVSLTIAASLFFVAGCSAAEPMTEDGEAQAAQSKTLDTEVTYAILPRHTQRALLNLQLN